MTSLLVRGKVHTFDASRPVATNLLLRDGVVQEVGSDAEHADRIIELEPDEIVQPGWRDDHLHLLATLATHSFIKLLFGSPIAWENYIKLGKKIHHTIYS